MESSNSKEIHTKIWLGVDLLSGEHSSESQETEQLGPVVQPCVGGQKNQFGTGPSHFQYMALLYLEKCL